MKTIGVNLIALFSEQGSGAFRYIKLILQEMGNYNLHDCKFVIYKQECISEKYLDIPKSLDVEYVNVPNVGHGFKRIVFEQTLFYKYIKPCDVFYSYCSSMPFFLRTKKVFTLHDVYFLTEKERYGYIQRNYLKIITWLYIHVSSKIFTVSEFSKSEIMRYYRISADKLIITYNFVKPIPKVDRINGNLSDEKGIRIDLKIPFFLYVGNIHPGKNVIRMVEGFELFNKKLHKYQLLICGKPANDSDAIIAEIREYSDVHYLGYQSREVVDYLFQNCTAVVLVSLCEGFGIPPLEGIQYHKPALVSSGTSIPEVIGNAGVCVNPRNVEEIADGYEKIIENMKSFEPYYDLQIKKFSPKVTVETFMESLGISASSGK